jgi:hypothetical protein
VAKADQLLLWQKKALEEVAGHVTLFSPNGIKVAKGICDEIGEIESGGHQMAVEADVSESQALHTILN